LLGIPRSRENMVLELCLTWAGVLRVPARVGGAWSTMFTRLCGMPNKRPPGQNPALGALSRRGGTLGVHARFAKLKCCGSKFDPRPDFCLKFRADSKVAAASAAAAAPPSAGRGASCRGCCVRGFKIAACCWGRQERQLPGFRNHCTTRYMGFRVPLWRERRPKCYI
jgi:hypothetical protein